MTFGVLIEPLTLSKNYKFVHSLDW